MELFPLWASKSGLESTGAAAMLGAKATVPQRVVPTIPVSKRIVLAIVAVILNVLFNILPGGFDFLCFQGRLSHLYFSLELTTNFLAIAESPGQKRS
jgi:hypothetical protein